MTVAAILRNRDIVLRLHFQAVKLSGSINYEFKLGRYIMTGAGAASRIIKPTHPQQNFNLSARMTNWHRFSNLFPGPYTSIFRPLLISGHYTTFNSIQNYIKKNSIRNIFVNFRLRSPEIRSLNKKRQQPPTCLIAISFCPGTPFVSRKKASSNNIFTK